MPQNSTYQLNEDQIQNDSKCKTFFFQFNYNNQLI